MTSLAAAPQPHPGASTQSLASASMHALSQSSWNLMPSALSSSMLSSNHPFTNPEQPPLANALQPRSSSMLSSNHPSTNPEQSPPANAMQPQSPPPASGPGSMTGVASSNQAPSRGAVGSANPVIPSETAHNLASAPHGSVLPASAAASGGVGASGVVGSSAASSPAGVSGGSGSRSGPQTASGSASTNSVNTGSGDASLKSGVSAPSSATGSDAGGGSGGEGSGGSGGGGSGGDANGGGSDVGGGVGDVGCDGDCPNGRKVTINNNILVNTKPRPTF